MKYSLAQWYAIGYHDYKNEYILEEDFKFETKDEYQAWRRGLRQALEDLKEFDDYRFSKLFNARTSARGRNYF